LHWFSSDHRTDNGDGPTSTGIAYLVVNAGQQKTERTKINSGFFTVFCFGGLYCPPITTSCWHHAGNVAALLIAVELFNSFFEVAVDRRCQRQGARCHYSTTARGLSSPRHRRSNLDTPSVSLPWSAVYVFSTAVTCDSSSIFHCRPLPLHQQRTCCSCCRSRAPSYRTRNLAIANRSRVSCAGHRNDLQR